MSKLLNLIKKDKLTKADIAAIESYEEKRWTYEEAIQWLTEYNLIADFFEDRSWQFVFKQMSEDQYDKLEHILLDYSGNGISIEYIIENEAITVVCVRFDAESIKLLGKEAKSMVKMQEVLIKSDENNCIFGWAYSRERIDGTQVIDHSGEFVKAENFEDLEIATYAYNLAYRQADNQHDLLAKGYLVESMVFSKEKMAKMKIPEGIVPEAIWMGFYFPDDNDYEEIKKMNHPMFSFYGTVTKELVEEVE